MHVVAQTDMNGYFSSDIIVDGIKNQKVAGFSHNNPVILKVLKSPTSTVLDIAFDGTNLWVEGGGNFVLYKVSPVNGTVLKTIPTNIIKPYGLEFINGSLFVVDNDNNIIQKVDTSNGSIISTFPTPAVSPSSYPSGLAWDGQYLWHNDAMSSTWNLNDSTFQISTSGQIIQAHHGFGEFVTGLAWDGQYLWSSDNKRLELYKIDVNTFSVLDTINAPGGLYPNGLAFDGQHLWVSNNDRDSLYQISISTVTELTDLSMDNNAGLSLYPNPTIDEISIKINAENLGSTYMIADQLGRVLLKGKFEKETTTFNIENFARGIYYCEIGKKKKPLKIIKQ